MSSFEAVARARKVAALAALVPPARGRWHARRLACRLARFTPEERARCARAAGVAAPSELTWRWLIDAVREARL